VLKKKNKDAVKRKPVRVVLTGIAGSGKSTAMGTVSKKALILDLDHRWPKSLVDKHDFADLTETFKGTKEYLKAIVDEPKVDNDWLVIDTTTKLMGLVETWTIQMDCKGDREKYNAYGHGLRFAHQYFQEVLDLLDQIQEKHQINVAFICHSKLKDYKNPMGENYVKSVLDLPDIVSDRLLQHVDAVGFVYFDVEVDKEKHKAKGPAKRIVTFNDNVLHVAKNGMPWNLPDKIPFDIEGNWAQLVFQGSYPENREIVTKLEAALDAMPEPQRATIRNRFEEMCFRAMSTEQLKPYLEQAQKSGGKA
jgi:hypothetical protein